MALEGGHSSSSERLQVEVRVHAVGSKEDRDVMVTMAVRGKQLPSLATHPQSINMSVITLSLLICCQLALGFSPSPLVSISKTPSNSRLLSAATTEMPEGLVKTVTKPGNGPPLKLGDVASVKYSCYLPDEAPFARSEFQKVVSLWTTWVASVFPSVP